MIKKEDQLRKDFLNAARILSEVVGDTLGPKGKTIVIKENHSDINITKDGVTVAKSIKSKNPTQNICMKMMSDIAINTNDKVGDGTTTSIILSYELIKEISKGLSFQTDIQKLFLGIKKAGEITKKIIDESTIPCNSISQLEKIATISSNNDSEIGRIVAEAVNIVGPMGLVTVDEAKTTETSLEITSGFKIDIGYISHHFVNNEKKTNCEFKDALVIILNYKITTADIKFIISILDYTFENGKSLLLICEDIEQAVLNIILINRLKLMIKICPIKIPGFGSEKKDLIEDISIITGAKIINKDEISDDINENEKKEFDKKVFGKSEKVVVTDSETHIITREKNDNCKRKIEEIEYLIHNEEKSFKKDNLMQRINRLNGKSSIIRVGGSTESIIKEKQYRVIDAVHSTKAALEGGMIPGGGLIYLIASNNIKNQLFEDNIIKIGANIFAEALLAPIKRIIDNGEYPNRDIIINRISIENSENKKKFVGFDALKGDYTNMLESGIVDASKVSRIIIDNSINSVSLMMQTGSIIINEIN